jgi:hypothetical protein
MKTKYENHEVVRVVGDGAISDAAVHDGRLVVVLLLDCSKQQHIVDVIRLHAGTLPGDVVSTWATAKSPEWTMGLHLNFLRPTPGEVMVLFDMPRHLFLVDSIIQNHACYIQSSRHGVKLSEAFSSVPRILLEIPSEEMPVDWEKEIEKRTFQRFRNEGLSRPQAKRATTESIKEIRDFHHFRRNIK